MEADEVRGGLQAAPPPKPLPPTHPAGGRVARPPQTFVIAQTRRAPLSKIGADTNYKINIMKSLYASVKSGKWELSYSLKKRS